MENSFFVFTNKSSPTEIERFHICSWEFKNNTSLIEFGFEIESKSLKGDNLSLSLFVPWLTKECKIEDLYEKLSIASNSRFIFNDSVSATNYLDGGQTKLGVVHKFSGRNELCILPVNFVREGENVVTANISLLAYNTLSGSSRPNVYCRFMINPKISHISMRKNGISKSTVIFDIKVNEKRNMPQSISKDAYSISFSKIKSCFCLNIIPNNYDISFLETEHLRKVRNLEYASFSEYLNDDRVKENDYLVVVHKKDNLESYSFFSIFAKERIGSGQFALAILINLICGILLFVPSYRRSFLSDKSFGGIVVSMPFEFYLAIAITLSASLYFLWPRISSIWKK